MKRMVSIWLPHLMADWTVIREPQLRDKPFVLTTLSRGRKLITVAGKKALAAGIGTGMSAADARALVPDLEVLDETPMLQEKLLATMARWLIRFSPFTAVDLPGALIIDASGCTHLWGGEKKYLESIIKQFAQKGYEAHAAVADTIGAAWAASHFCKGITIIPAGEQLNALVLLPPAALRLELLLLDKLQKLGFYTIGQFIQMPRTALRRRFGPALMLRIDQALGLQDEVIHPIQPIPEYEERLPCLEPIVTAGGIEIALRRLLEALCTRLEKCGKGIRTAAFHCMRVDGKKITLQIGTNHATLRTEHLFRLFGDTLQTIEPALGIELFSLEATRVEDIDASQELLWAGKCGLQDQAVVELLDRIACKLGPQSISRYLPAEHYWPERSIKRALSLKDLPATHWQDSRQRPIELLQMPERIEVTAPIPDYPPMLFRYKGSIHSIKKADGPERIEREWWIEEGEHRDYYCVEDEAGQRYWLFRAGHYDGSRPHTWFIHGFFA